MSDDNVRDEVAATNSQFRYDPSQHINLESLTLSDIQKYNDEVCTKLLVNGFDGQIFRKKIESNHPV